MIMEQQTLSIEKQGYYNVGPEEGDCVTVGKLADIFCEKWGGGASWKNVCEGGPHEAAFLKLDCSYIKNKIGWKSHWNIEKAVEKTVEWTKVFQAHGNIKMCMENQINEFFKGRVNP